MDAYLSQLLRDIASATSEFEHFSPPRSEDEFFELFLSDMSLFTLPSFPARTMGHYLGMNRIEFPDAKLLSEEQCRAVAEALKTAFSKFHVELDIPKDAPYKAQYLALCGALDKQVVITRLGTTHLETCPIPFWGYCPYGMEKCRCYLNWREEIIDLIKHPNEEGWNRKGEIALFKILRDIKECLHFLQTIETPFKESVLHVFDKLYKAWITFNAEGIAVWYNPDSYEIAIQPGRTLLEWTGQSPIVFPEYEGLHPKESYLLTCAMLLLVHESDVLPQAVILEPEACYAYLVKHLQCELCEGTWNGEATLLCIPDQAHIYHKITCDRNYWVMSREPVGKFF
jgi:hypothetical protein